MDDRGRIWTPDEIAAMAEADRKARKLVPIPDGDLQRVQGMNRHARRKWYAEQRRAARKGA
jgi:hypothetical protein